MRACDRQTRNAPFARLVRKAGYKDRCSMPSGRRPKSRGEIGPSGEKRTLLIDFAMRAGKQIARRLHPPAIWQGFDFIG
jgi:hypothetical protein